MYNKLKMYNSKTLTNYLENDQLNREYLEEKHTNIEKILILDLSEQSWKTIIADTFKSFTQLTVLDLHNNLIESLEPTVFEGLSNLKQLYLYGNSLNRIKSDTFNSLSKLELLTLDDNKIGVLEARLFEGLASLKQLGLSGNRLAQIKSGAFKSLSKLEILRLSDNQIKVLDPNGFEGLVSLKELWLDGNKLSRINDVFKSLTQLEEVALNYNQIGEIDPVLFEGLTNLKGLYLEGNKLKILHRSCFEDLTSIGIIDLHKNNFDTNVVSYFNRKILEDWNPKKSFLYDSESYNISEYESFISKEFSIIDDFQVFLNQFPQVSSKRNIH